VCYFVGVSHLPDIINGDDIVSFDPLFVIMGVGIAFVTLYVGRLASKTTDINWSKNKMEDQYGYYTNRQFKWFNPRGVDYSSISDKRGAPNYKD